MRRMTRCYRDWSSDVCSSALAGTSAQPNCDTCSGVVSSSRLNTSIWVTSTASTNSPKIARFITLLSNVAVVNTVPVSLRHSRAADRKTVVEGEYVAAGDDGAL